MNWKDKLNAIWGQFLELDQLTRYRVAVILLIGALSLSLALR